MSDSVNYNLIAEEEAHMDGFCEHSFCGHWTDLPDYDEDGMPSE